MLTDSNFISIAYLYFTHVFVSKLIKTVQHQIWTYFLLLNQRRQLYRQIQA